MQIKDVMSRKVQYVPTSTTLRDAADTMKRFDTGFLPIGNSEQDKLRGVITDRDITVRGVADGLDPNQATVEQVKTDRVLYCFEDDSLDAAARNMSQQEVYRLVVLDNRDDKRMTGVVSLADISRQGKPELAGEATREITA